MSSLTLRLSCNRATVIVVHSTVLPATMRTVAEIAAAHEVATVDAAVSGGAWVAERGELTLMVEGRPTRLHSVARVGCDRNCQSRGRAWIRPSGEDPQQLYAGGVVAGHLSLPRGGTEHGYL